MKTTCIFSFFHFAILQPEKQLHNTARHRRGKRYQNPKHKHIKVPRQITHKNHAKKKGIIYNTCIFVGANTTILVSPKRPFLPFLSVKARNIGLYLSQGVNIFNFLLPNTLAIIRKNTTFAPVETAKRTGLLLIPLCLYYPRFPRPTIKGAANAPFPLYPMTDR